MVTKIIWVSNNGKPNLKIEFVSEEEKSNFFKEVKKKSKRIRIRLSTSARPWIFSCGAGFKLPN